MSLTSSPNPANLGQAVTLTATVTPGATGKVTFYDGTTVLGTATLAGTHATFQTALLSSGARSLHAHYLGDSTYAPSNSNAVAESIVAVASLGLQTPTTFSPIANPQAIAIGDFNGDGKPDLVTDDGTSFSVSLGNGDGTFQPAIVSASAGASTPQSIAVADFNEDGKADIAVLNFSTSNFTILLGNGDGTFQSGATYTTILGNTGSIATADFNGDGIPDLIVGSSYNSYIGVYLGNGDGTFGTPTNIYGILNGNSIPFFIAVGDFNGDGKADFAVTDAGYQSVFIFSGNGDGTFQSAGNYSALYDVGQAFVGDFNGDGKLDLAVGNYYGIAIMLGNGDGTFQSPVIYYGAYNVARSVTGGDLNGDGKLDLVVGSYTSTTGLSVLYGNGDGTFQSGVPYASAYTLLAMAVGDFNGDGKTDIAGAYTGSTQGVVLLLGGALPDLSIGLTSNGFTEGQVGASYSILVSNVGAVGTIGAVGVANTLPSGFTATAISGSGWTCVQSTLACTRSDSLAAGASYPKIVVTVNISGTLIGNVTDTATVSGGGDQNFANNSASLTSFVRNGSSVSVTSSPNPSTLGQTVILTASIAAAATGKMLFLDGVAILGEATIVNGQASFSTDQLSSGPRSIVAFYSGSSTYGPETSPVHTQTVNETATNGLQPSQSIKTDVAPYWVAVGDFNGDGKPDLVTANNNGDVSVLVGKGDGSFQPAVNYPAGAGPNRVVVADFNGDGKQDLAVSGSSGIYVLLGNGDGTFQTAVTYASGTQFNALVVADLNGDGIPDLAATSGNSILILPGNGDGTFGAPLTTPLAANGLLIVADFNKDGRPDLLFGYSGELASVALGNGDGTFQNAVALSVTVSGANAYAVGDFNNDGRLDIAVTYWVGAEVLLGNGDGTFQTPTPSSNISGVPGDFAIAGDFNGDGKLDIAIQSYAQSSFIMAFGNGDGTFSNGVAVNTDGYGGNFALGDFNLDGKLDIAVTNPYSNTNVVNTVDVFLGGQFSGVSISSTHTGYFTAGQQGAIYQLTVSNPAYASTNSTVSVTDTLPSGLTATAISGSGWSCVLSTLTCTRSDALSSGNSYSPITVTVNVSSSAPASTVNNTAKVTFNGITNTATDPTSIRLATTNTLVISPTSALYGQAVTLTATVTNGGTGTVTFLDDVTILGSGTLSGGQATLTTKLLPIGTRFLKAFYVGDATHGASLSNTVYLFVESYPISGLSAAINSTTGSTPIGMAVGDFNGDGRADLVTANSGASTVSVLLGNGDGTFATHADFNVGTKPVAVAIGDFNADGKQDLAVINQTGNSLSILLGKGDGTFQSAVSYATGNGPSQVVVADFNGDGIADVAVANSTDGTLSVFFGTGNGTFQAAKVVQFVTAVTTLSVGDFNNDGKADLLTGSYDAYLFLGNGDGTFSSTYVNYVNGPSATGFFRNLNQDVVTATSNGVQVYLGSGTGNYSASATYTLPFTPVALTIADMNGDGFADIIAAGNGSLSVLIGKGDGTFQPAVSYGSIPTPGVILSADFNGDNRTDLAFTDSSGATVLLGVLESVLSITSTHQGDFNFNATDAYQVTVTNLGPAATSGTITVTDTLPAGLTMTQLAGAGWQCSVTGSNSGICSQSNSVGVGASYYPITVTVSVAGNATSPAVNQVSVTGANVIPASASDSTVINGGPPFPSLVSPANGATGVAPAPMLTWSAATGATSYDVYLGTSSPPAFVANTAATSYPTSTLLASQTYYWQIVAKNSGGANPSAVWSFTTVANRVATAALRDTYGAIRLSTYASSTLSNSGGAFGSDPTAAQDQNGNTFVTARDTFNAVWANVFNASGQTWQFGGGVIQGVPSIAVAGTTGWIASRDGYNSYWLLSYAPGSGFGAWVHLAGVFATDPVITACGDGSLYLVGKDNYNALWSGHYIPGTGFQGFVLGGGVVQGKPSVSCGNDNAAYIAARDNYNSSWVARVSGNAWTGWFNGGAVTSVDTRIAALGGSLAIVILDSTGAVYRTTFTEGTGNGWQPWTSVGGVLADIAPAGVGGELFFVGRTPTGNLYWWQQTGNQWTGIGNNGVAAGMLSSAPR